MAGIIQITLELDEGVAATVDPDPSGALVRAAKARGLSGQDLGTLSEDRLSGSLRLTLTEERAAALALEIESSLTSD